MKHPKSLVLSAAPIAVIGTALVFAGGLFISPPTSAQGTEKKASAKRPTPTPTPTPTPKPKPKPPFIGGSTPVPKPPPPDTRVVLTLSDGAASRGKVTLTARLTQGGKPVAGKTIAITVFDDAIRNGIHLNDEIGAYGGPTVHVVTDSSGNAKAEFLHIYVAINGAGVVLFHGGYPVRLGARARLETTPVSGSAPPLIEANSTVTVGQY